MMKNFPLVRCAILFLMSMFLTGCFESRNQLIDSRNFNSDFLAIEFLDSVIISGQDSESPGDEPVRYELNNDKTFDIHFKSGKSCKYSLSFISYNKYVLQAWPSCGERDSFRYDMLSVSEKGPRFIVPTIGNGKASDAKNDLDYIRSIKLLAADYNFDLIFVEGELFEFYFRVLGDPSGDNFLDFLKIYDSSDLSIVQ